MARQLVRVQRENAHVFVMGNGGSAATASHLALHLRQARFTTGKLHVACLNDNIPLITAIANDEEYALVFESQLEGLVKPGDVVIVISGSGNSPNIVNAVRKAKDERALVMAFLGFGGGEVSRLADHQVTFSSRSYGPLEDAHMALVHILSRLIAED